jgi:isoaspartyl peptidase/L-asparaginase-like protein (Ntn-hydrolase superfamily)
VASPEQIREQQLDAVIVEMETRHPEFNPDHPRFDEKLADEALARMQTYIKQGIDPASALRMAVLDMEEEGSFRVGRGSAHGNAADRCLLDVCSLDVLALVSAKLGDVAACRARDPGAVFRQKDSR